MKYDTSYKEKMKASLALYSCTPAGVSHPNCTNCNQTVGFDTSTMHSYLLLHMSLPLGVLGVSFSMSQ